MKKKCMMISCFLLLIILIVHPIALRAEDKILGIENDKLAHAFAGFTGQVICEAVTNRVFKNSSQFSRSLSCFLLITTIGITKELIDPMYGSKQEAWDVGAGMIGSGLAIPVLRFGFS